MNVIVGAGRWMLHWAVEAVSPVVGGCAGFVVGQVAGPQVGVYAGRGVQFALDYFGKHIADIWIDRLHSRSPAEQQAAIEELAALSPEEARREVAEAIEKLGLDASPEDKALAIEYLAAIPQTVARSLVRDPGTGRATMPAGLKLDDPRTFLHMLPVNVPPYVAPCELPGTTYRLAELAGVGGFAAVYRAVDPKLPYLSLAIKFCLDRSFANALKQERGNLERLIRAGGEAWSSRVVRLYGYDLEHPTPYLVYEHAAGGDLARYVADEVAAGRRPTPEQVRRWVAEIAEGLSFAHRHGIVHRDLKPANILLGLGAGPADGPSLKVTDFGVGGPSSAHVLQFSRIGTLSANQLALSEQASLLRGAGTPLYMSPEQRRGDAPDPRHDVYSLGVIWYQLLLGDCGRELHPGWADELAEEGVPADQVDLIRQCVGMLKRRPADAAELLTKLREKAAPAATPVKAVSPVPQPLPAPPSGRPPRQLVQQLARIRELHAVVERNSDLTITMRVWSVATGLTVFCTLTGILGTLSVYLAHGFSHGGPGEELALYASGAVFFSIWGAFWVVRRYQRARIRERIAPYWRQLELEVDLVSTNFPDHVRAWGGADLLFDAMQAEKIFRRLQYAAGSG